MNKCEGCLYYRARRHVAIGGECHRYPPAALGVGRVGDFYFPHIEKDDWCGEWKTDNIKDPAFSVGYKDGETGEL